jgi:sugar lactone lactonase YvrE
MPVAERIGEPIAYHGEGPIWDPVASRLLIVDMLAGDVLDVGDPAAPREPGGTVDRHHVGPVAAALRPRTSGGFVIATERGFSLVDENFAEQRSVPDVVPDDGTRMNDGGCDAQGRFYCGTMAYDERQGAGALYRLDADGEATVAFTGATISNGLQWDDSGMRAYYIDTPTQRVDAFDYDGQTGEFTNRKPFATIDVDLGSPDGMAIDEAGGLWVALWGGGAVLHYDDHGRLIEKVTVPGATQTTAVAFGGADLDVLYITTSKEGVSAHTQPSAGAVFCVTPGVRGRPLAAFAG